MLRGDLATQDKREKQGTRRRKNEMRYYFLEMALRRGSRRILFFKEKEIGRNIKEKTATEFPTQRKAYYKDNINKFPHLGKTIRHM
jgi:hypothetical protein